MRDILFRGKRVDTGEWVYGYYAKARDIITEEDIHIIFPLDLIRFPGSEFDGHFEVIPETIGRFIEHPCYNWGELHDEQRLFEGDIVEVYWSHDCIEYTYPRKIAIVVNESCITENGLGRVFPQDTVQVKLIGNVHDNPELVGVKYADMYKYHFGFKAENKEVES